MLPILIPYFKNCAALFQTFISCSGSNQDGTIQNNIPSTGMFQWTLPGTVHHFDEFSIAKAAPIYLTPSFIVLRELEAIISNFNWIAAIYTDGHTQSN